MIADLDEGIRQLLMQRGNLDSGEVDISFEMPTREWSARLAKPTVNVYLFDIRENKELKDPSAWTARRGPNNTAVKSRPPVRLDLSYRITAFASTVEDEHRLLSRVLLVLFRNPVFPSDLLQGEVAGQEVRTEVAQPDGIIQSPADYWGALDNDIRPAIDYKLTVALDVGVEQLARLVLTARYRAGQLDGANGLASVDELPVYIGGKVHHADDPAQGIAGARVTLLERALDTVTDAEGRYLFQGVPAGRYTLVISAPGMEPERRELEVPSGSYDVGL